MLLRLATLNIRHGPGLDDVVDTARIAALLREQDADILCLQEVDFGLVRSGNRPQAQNIADTLGMSAALAMNYRQGRGGMGNAIVSRLAVHSTWNTPLPHKSERRGVLHALVNCKEAALHIACTHWGLDTAERTSQALATIEALAESRVILAGDFNAAPGSAEITTLRQAGFTDSWPNAPPTYPSWAAAERIDYIFVRGFEVEDTRLITTDATDHYGLVVTLRL